MIRKIIFSDKELGAIEVRTNARAKHIVMRPQQDGVVVTLPYRLPTERIMEALDAHRERLKAQQAKLRKQQKRVNLGFRIDTAYLRLRLTEGNTAGKFFVKRQKGDVEIICPPKFDFDTDNAQAWIRKVVEEQIRQQALLFLPERLKTLSEQYGLPFNKVQIRSSKGRWGSCSSQKHISLSYYLVTLPPHLIDYVLLHELSHTREMNHGDRFWALMDKLTDGKSLVLRNEMKRYQTDIFNSAEEGV